MEKGVTKTTKEDLEITLHDISRRDKEFRSSIKIEKRGRHDKRPIKKVEIKDKMFKRKIGTGYVVHLVDKPKITVACLYDTHS